MNWRLILIVSLTGLVPGALSVFGVFHPEWLGFALGLLPVALAAWIFRHARRPFLSGLACGALLAIWQHLVMLLLWSTYAANNSSLIAMMVGDAPGMDPKRAILICMVDVALIYGVICGLLAWILSRAFRSRKRR